MPQIGAGRPHDFDDEEEFPRIVRVRDVLVVPSPGHRANEQDWLDNPPVEEAVDLGNGVFLGRLRGDDSDLPEQVMDSSSARGLNFEATRQFGQLYSFWRAVPAEEYEEHLFAWDPANTVGEALAISRFVLDNAHSFEFAGRVIDRSDGYRKIACSLSYDGRIAYLWVPKTRSACKSDFPGAQAEVLVPHPRRSLSRLCNRRPIYKEGRSPALQRRPGDGPQR